MSLIRASRNVLVQPCTCSSQPGSSHPLRGLGVSLNCVSTCCSPWPVPGLLTQSTRQWQGAVAGGVVKPMAPPYGPVSVFVSFGRMRMVSGRQQTANTVYQSPRLSLTKRLAASTARENSPSGTKARALPVSSAATKRVRSPVCCCGWRRWRCRSAWRRCRRCLSGVLRMRCSWSRAASGMNTRPNPPQFARARRAANSAESLDEAADSAESMDEAVVDRGGRTSRASERGACPSAQ